MLVVIAVLLLGSHQSGAQAPVINNSQGASNITLNSAVLCGNLVSDGGFATTVRVFWGAVNGGTNAAVWSNSVTLGLRSPGFFTADVTGLSTTTVYYYRSYASNAVGATWGTSATNFTTGDSDSDGMQDAWETAYFGGLQRDGTGDDDADGLADRMEFQNNTDPFNPDCDDDGVGDFVEVINLSDPLNSGSRPSYPCRLWSRIWGGQGVIDGSNCTKVVNDDAGNIYVGGPTDGSFDGQTNNGMFDFCLTKLDNNGNKIWTRIWGSANFERQSGLAWDRASSNVYVCGYSESAFDGQTNSGLSDICLSKYSPDGDRLWTRIWGSDGKDYAMAVRTDGSGYVYVACTAAGSFGGQTSTGGTDFCVVKLDPQGNFIWTKIWGSSGNDAVRDMWIQSDSNLYILGVTTLSIDGQAHPHSGWMNPCLIRLRADNGCTEWTRIWGSSLSYADAKALIVSDGGTVFACGSTDGKSSFDGQTSSGNFTDNWLTKFDGCGAKLWSLVWSSSYPMSFGALGGIAMGSADCAYIACSEASSYGIYGKKCIALRRFLADGSPVSSNIWGDVRVYYGASADDVIAVGSNLLYLSGGMAMENIDGQTKQPVGIGDFIASKWLIAPALAVAHRSVCNIRTNSALIGGNLLSVGETNRADVYVCWGLFDGGTNAGAWTHAANLGSRPLGLFTTNVSGLLSNTVYYARCAASNAYGPVWAPSTLVFTTDCDSDLDGMPDGWEAGYFGNLDKDGSADSDSDGLTDRQEYDNDSSPVSKDTDGDGLDDRQEMIAGSDPSDSASRFCVPAPVRPGAGINMLIEWPTLTGRSYTVWSDTNLLTTNWMLEYRVEGDGQPKSYTNSGSDSHKYFRLEVDLRP